MKNALLSIGLLACLVAGFTTSRVLPAARAEARKIIAEIDAA